MNNKQLLPFERNRYYAGKMLASMDFKAEQLYMNNKRRFLNSMLFGPGVICGLEVSSLDDLTVLIESGAALDEGGREIVLESSAVKKLSAMEGFEKLSGERAQLRIRYTEEKVHPVYAMGNGENGEEYECNRIREGYELFLTDCIQEKQHTVPFFFHEAVFLENEDYRAVIHIPKTVCKGHYARLTVKAIKLSDRKKALSFEGILQLPAFVTEDGTHELSVGMQDILLEKGQQYKKDYWILAEKTAQDMSSIMWKQGSGQAFVGEYDVPIRQDIVIKTQLCKEEPEQMVLAQTAVDNLEAAKSDGREGILLAEIQMFRTEGAYVIASVSDERSYIAPPARSAERQQYLACFAEPSAYEKREKVQTDNIVNGQAEKGFEMPLMTSGTLEIPLDVNMKKGDVCFSEEILHGLGSGDVFVQAGVACLEETDGMGGSVKSTIYGDSDLFREQDHSWMKTAVKVFHDKGSFQVAARLEGEQKSIVLLINWVAMRFNSSQESRLTEDYSEMSIAARVPTVRLGAGKSCHIDILFRGMAPCRLVYELTENGSGEITQDGIYTAPASKGLYEIHVYCADIPQIDTYVYTIVEK